jgi:RNA polymerase sigma-70 factor (ECF subfamily)
MVAGSLKKVSMSLPPATGFRNASSIGINVTDERKVMRGNADCAEPTDETLIVRVQADDQDALGRLFERYARLVRGVSARILKDVSEADDLVQDLFLFIKRKASIFDGTKSSARSWIIQMAYHRAIDRRRYLTSRHFYTHEAIQDATEQISGTPVVEGDYSPDAVFGRNGIKKVFAALSDNQRQTIRLFFFDGYTFQEISEKLGQPVGNIKHHYFRGLEKLRKQMFDDNKKVG